VITCVICADVRYSKLKEDNLHGSELLKVYCLFNWRACPHSVILTKFLHSGELSGDEPTISENLALKVSSFRFISTFHFDFLFSVCVVEQNIILSVNFDVFWR